MALLKLPEEETGRKGVYDSAYFFSSLKALSQPEIEAYGERITALARLERHGDPLPAKIVEWLVATAEEPLTRQEAADELRDALTALAATAEGRGVSTEQEAQDLQTLADRFLADGGSFEPGPAPNLFAAYLTEEQKERLSKALLATTSPLTEGDLDLFKVVRPWAGEAATSWLIRRFRDAEPPAAGVSRQVMGVLAEELLDGKLKALVEAADAENEAYWESLTLDSADEKFKLAQEKSIAAEKELRHRFLAMLDGQR